MRCLRSFCAVLLFSSPILFAQAPNATINGRVVDPTRAVIPGATVDAINEATNVRHAALTNDAGLFAIAGLPPGTYRVEVTKTGFRTIVKPNVTLHVQDVIALNFDMSIGSTAETVTVEAGAPLLNTEDASISTVVDRQFAENLPMNGRSFQTLIELTPGVVLTPSTSFDSGQFSVNGQRASSNYWMVDGVSANIGMSASNAPIGGGVGGTLGSFSAQGGTNSLVSVDALQEFRIQTSTYAPEFGRTPGAQISILTRSGTNNFHGTLFDYLRNDAMDANNWFNGYINNPPLPKSKERQNDFGGTFGGPIVRDRSFFFFSYEGLRLQLPQTALTTVPSVLARQSASAAMQPYLNAFPVPNGSSNPTTAIAQFNASYSNPASLDAYSLRVDQLVTDKLALFGRYNYSPSQTSQRAAGVNSANTLLAAHLTTETATVGATYLFSPRISNDLRVNYSRSGASSRTFMDDFGGAVPLSTLPFPSPFTSSDAGFFFRIISLANGNVSQGAGSRNIQHQMNIVDAFLMQRGSHSLKFGADIRRLSPELNSSLYNQQALFLSVPAAESGKLLLSLLQSLRGETLLLHNIGVFAQDTWRIVPRFTLTYGLRWDLDIAPSSLHGPSLAAVTGVNLHDFSQLALAPPGTPPFRTTYDNIAPRLGAAYQLYQGSTWQTVIRGGFGVFYDLATSEVGNNINYSFYPFGASTALPGGTFPLSSATAAPAAITSTQLSSGTLFAFDPNLQLPYTLQWNASVEQAIGKKTAITSSYIGSVGRRLVQTAQVSKPNAVFGTANIVTNDGTSDYNALQLQFQQQASRSVRALASYTWSHSIDTASASSAFGDRSNALVAALDPNVNRAASDFDIRNAFSAGLIYDIPTVRTNVATRALLSGWSLESLIQARSAPPVDIFNSSAALRQLLSSAASVRPDLVPGVPLYLYGAQCIQPAPSAFGKPCPGGKGFNPNAFTYSTPGFVVNGAPTRQGTLGRNTLRGFGATQWDFAVHRDFALHEALKLQFRSELFNVLNHPNFAQPQGDLSNGAFGLSSALLSQGLGGSNVGGGGLSALYQIGGPRSIQFALKLQF